MASNNAWIASSDIDGWIAVRSWPNQELIREVQISNSAVDTVRWLPDGVTAAAALRDGTIALCSARDGTRSALKDRHPASAVGLAVDARHNRIVSSGDRGEVLIWDIATRDKIATLPSSETVKVATAARDSIALTPDGRYAVVAGNDGNLLVMTWTRSASTMCFAATARRWKARHSMPTRRWSRP